MSGRLTLTDFYLQMIVWGWPGSGKTWLITSFDTCEHTKPMLYLHCRGNVRQAMTLRNKDLRAWNITSASGVDLPLEFLLLGQPKNHPFRKALDLEPDFKFKSVGFDTLTDWQVLKGDELLRGQQGRAAENYIELLPDYVKQLSVAPPPKPSYWMDLQHSTSAVAGQLFNLPLHVVIGLQKDVRIDFTGKTPPEVVLALSTKVRDRIPGWVQLVGEMQSLYLPPNALGKVVGWDGTPFTKDEPVPKITWTKQYTGGGGPIQEGPNKNQVAKELGTSMWCPDANKIFNILSKAGVVNGA